jgi:hypothetical protein
LTGFRTTDRIGNFPPLVFAKDLSVDSLAAEIGGDFVDPF